MKIDPRAPRFAAAVTAAVLAIGLVTSSAWVLGAQAVVFALGAVLGLQASPYSALYRVAVRPRLGPPAELEDAAAPRFAQAVGLAFALVATLGFATGAQAVGITATALAFAAAFLNAAFGYCLGCEFYLLARRLTARSAARPAPASDALPHSPAVTSAATKEVPA